MVYVYVKFIIKFYENIYINYICQRRNFRIMSRVAPEVILRSDARRDVIESEGARGTYCGIAYVVLFTD